MKKFIIDVGRSFIIMIGTMLFAAAFVGALGGMIWVSEQIASGLWRVVPFMIQLFLFCAICHAVYERID